MQCTASLRFLSPAHFSHFLFVLFLHLRLIFLVLVFSCIIQSLCLISTRFYCVINQTMSETEFSFDECVLAPVFICVWNRAVFGSQCVCAWVMVTWRGRSPRQRSRGAVSSRGRKAQMVEVCLHQQCKRKTPSVLQMQGTYTDRGHTTQSHAHITFYPEYTGIEPDTVVWFLLLIPETTLPQGRGQQRCSSLIGSITVCTITHTHKQIWTNNNFKKQNKTKQNAVWTLIKQRIQVHTVWFYWIMTIFLWRNYLCSLFMLYLHLDLILLYPQ